MTQPRISQDVFLGPVFDALPVGVVVLDANGDVKAFNRHEELLAQRQRERVLGKSFFHEVAPCMNVRELAGRFFRGVNDGGLDTRVEFSFPFPHVNQPRDVVVKMLSVDIESAPHGMLIIEDVSMQRAVERMKESLATLLVHDFKNPLTAIRANIEFVSTLVADRPAATEALDDSLESTNLLSSMVLNLLDIARIETGTFPINLTATDLRALAASVVQSNQGLARLADVRLEADLPPSLVANVDAGAVRRCLANLVENALRHAPVHTRVVVAGEPAADGVVLRVSDAGPGVPEELREVIFEKFTQGGTHGRTSDNRGLGLTFVRMVARAHGGDVRVVEAGAGGATFELVLRSGTA